MSWYLHNMYKTLTTLEWQEESPYHITSWDGWAHNSFNPPKPGSENRALCGTVWALSIANSTFLN